MDHAPPNREEAEGVAATQHRWRGIFKSVATEIGEIIVADVVKDRIKELVASDRSALEALIKG